MALETFNVEMVEGEDLVYPLRWTNKETGDPIDLTGSQIFFEADQSEFDLVANITDALDGKYEFNLPAATTAGTVADLRWRTVKYLVKHVSSGGITTFLFRIHLTVVGAHD
jgi:hypothetical protein